MKKIALIPALLGSTRVANKNILMVEGFPMAFYVAQACKESGVFDAVYLNSDHPIFAQMAQMLGVKFYQRPPDRGGSACRMSTKSRHCTGDRCQTDHFLFDFMQAQGPCYLVMVHTTSPLLKPETIRSFVETLEKEDYDSFFTVEERHTEALYQGQPLNFSFSKKIPTQMLTPIQLITWSISAWKSESYVASFLRDDPEENGPTFCGKTGVFPIDRIQALDADTWDELYTIEACLQHKRQGEKPGQFLFREQILGIERSLGDMNGVSKFEAGAANLKLSNLEEIKKKMGPPPWGHLLVHSATDSAALICQRPGEETRKCCHLTHAEWWIVLEGEFEWRLEDGSVIRAGASDVVCLPRGMSHQIVCVSKEPGIRLACGARDMEYVYVP